MISILSPLVATSPGSVLSVGEMEGHAPSCPKLLARRVATDSGSARLPARESFADVSGKLPETAGWQPALPGRERSARDDSRGRLARLMKRLLALLSPFKKEAGRKARGSKFQP